jgi:CelD/BcsL family acetyltransferase involved in cellulose biosynthesis
MAARRQARILTLDVAGRPVAAQLVLTAPGGTFLGLSGVAPEWWHVSPVTLLQFDAAREAVEQGHRTFNLSVGPSVSKLRWSEQIVQHPEFAVCGPRRSSRLAFTGFRMVAAVAAIRREAQRHAKTEQPAQKAQQPAAPQRLQLPEHPEATGSYPPGSYPQGSHPQGGRARGAHRAPKGASPLPGKKKETARAHHAAD